MRIFQKLAFLRINVHLSMITFAHQLTQQIEASVEDGNGSTVSNVFGQRIDQNGQITANIVHDKEEDADCGRTHLHGYNFHQHSEHDAEPHLSWKSKEISGDGKLVVALGKCQL